MRIADHLAKISWTLADKLLFLLYGFFVRLWQISLLPTEEFGLFGHLEVWHVLILTISDGLALQGLIKFGVRAEDRAKVNFMSLILHAGFCLGMSLLLFGLFWGLPAVAEFFNEPRLSIVAVYLPLYVVLSIPRTFCLKLLYRDVQMRAIFSVNLVWFGTMAGLTGYLAATNSLTSFEDLAGIHIIGMAVSSLHMMLITRSQLNFGRAGGLSWQEFWTFGRNTAATVGVNNATLFVEQLIVQKFFGTQIVGIYQAAKTLFRSFDALRDALVGLVFPGAVRLVAERDRDKLHAFLSKAISFYLVVAVVAVALLEFGMAELIITSFLPIKYHSAISLFRLLLVAALFQPIYIGVAFMVARGDTLLLLRFVLICAAVSLGSTLLVGMTGIFQLVPLGSVLYFAVLAALTFRYTARFGGLCFSDLLRAIPDSLDFLRRMASVEGNSRGK